MRPAICTVSQITRQIRQLLERGFSSVWVRGEISECTQASSRHVYFTLKDADARLSCAWFFHKQRPRPGTFNPLTGEVYPREAFATVEDLGRGGEFLIWGSLSVYEQRGVYQLIVDAIILDERFVLGRLAQEFERLKARLAQAGYFSHLRKRPIPLNPGRVALITSEQGAAIRDFLVIAGTRGLSSRIRLYPSLVQGRGAAEEIAGAIRLANRHQWADVIVLIRGGGSLEDLWCFNEIPVAEAVFSSAIPVLAGIGHEVDVTLADMTADCRAATPTHAAEILWTRRTDLLRILHENRTKLFRTTSKFLSLFDQRLSHSIRLLRYISPLRRIEMLSVTLRNTTERLHKSMQTCLDRQDARLRTLIQTLRRVMPEERIVRQQRELDFLAGRLNQLWDRFLASRSGLLQRHTELLAERTEKILDRKSQELENLMTRLFSCNPKALLTRGYALIEDRNGKIITSVHQTGISESITISLGDGVIHADVQDIAVTPPEDRKL